MTYLVLDVIFVGFAAVVLVVARRVSASRAQGASGRRAGPSLPAIGWSFLALAVMTAVFDNLMIAAGLFEFAPAHLVGLWIGKAPVEDLGYPAAAILLLPALWHLLAPRSPHGTGARVDARAAGAGEGPAR